VGRRTLISLLAIAAALAGAAPAVAAGAPWYRDGPSGRILLTSGWLFRADPNDEGLAGAWAEETDTSGWSAVTVPNAWNTGDFSDASMDGTVGWYRRDFEVPRRPRGALWVVRFESVNYRATVFLNGVQVAEHEGASIPFEVPLRNLQPGVNRLVVRVDSRRGPTDLPPGPRGGWWNFGGILREVYLRPIDGVDIQELLTRTVARDELLVRATLWNPGDTVRRATVTASVAGRSARLGSVRVPGGRTRSVSARLTIPNARPWLPRRPVLYTVTATASIRGRAVARYRVDTGLRRVAIRPDGRLTVNGVPVDLRGAALHEQTLARGAALTPADHAHQIALLRALGATITRSHYPLSEDFLERADRAGIFVWEEIPVYQLTESALRDPAVRRKALDYLATAIRRDQNHPSVLVWSIGNELPPSPGAGQHAYIRQAVALAHRLDPTRPVALAIAGYPTKGYIAGYGPLDALGINDYFGWYPGPFGQIVNRGALGEYLNRLHATYPRKALFISEFGAEANRDGPPEEKGTYAFQDEFMRFHLATYAKRPFLSGAINWTLQDFAVRPQWTGGNPQPQPPWLRKGLVDEYGRRKPAWSMVSRSYHRARPLVR
jgi:beta-glucuronidase